jgi:hypothetical protein
MEVKLYHVETKQGLSSQRQRGRAGGPCACSRCGGNAKVIAVEETQKADKDANNQAAPKTPVLVLFFFLFCYFVFFFSFCLILFLVYICQFQFYLLLVDFSFIISVFYFFIFSYLSLFSFFIFSFQSIFLFLTFSFQSSFLNVFFLF